MTAPDPLDRRWSSFDRLKENGSNDWTSVSDTHMLPVKEKRMKFSKTVLTATGFLGLASLLLAQPVQRQTKLTISEPTEVSGTILQPGNYLLKVHDFKGGKVQVQVMDGNDNRVFATVTAMRARRNLDTDQQQAEQTEFTYTTANGHPALATWFYPGDEWGEQFASGKVTWIAESNSGGIAARAPVQTETRSVEVVKTPAPVAEGLSTAPEPATPVAKTTRSELPKTGSTLPLFGLIGFGALACGAVLHVARRVM